MSEGQYKPHFWFENQQWNVQHNIWRASGLSVRDAWYGLKKTIQDVLDGRIND